MRGEGSPALLHRGHLSHPPGGGEPVSDAAALGIRGVGMGARGRARPTQKLQHQLAASIPHHPMSTSSPISLPLRWVCFYSLPTC